MEKHNAGRAWRKFGGAVILMLEVSR